MLKRSILCPFAFRILNTVAFLALASCTPRSIHQNHYGQTVSDSLRPIFNVLANHTAEWMNIPGVIGTGETKKENHPAIIIFVDSLTDTLASQLPSSVEGYQVVIEQSGKVVTLPLPKR